MKPLNFARALRARSKLMVVVALVGACLSVLAPPAPQTYDEPSTSLEDAASAAHARFSATSLLGVPPVSSSGASQGQFATLAFYLKSAQISRAFADRLGYGGDDLDVIGRLVSVDSDPKTATVAVKGFGGSARQAAEVVRAYVLTVQDYLAGLSTVSSQQSLKDARASVASLRTRIDNLGERIAKLEAAKTKLSRTDPQVSVLQAKHDALIASYIAAYQRYTRLSADVAPTISLIVLQPATAIDARAVPPSMIYKLPFRILLGLLVGLCVGAALALLLEQYGRKVTSRASAEELFRVPVLAEIPKRRLTAAAVAGRQSSAAGPYRMLRAILTTLSVPRTGAPVDISHRGLPNGSEVIAPANILYPAALGIATDATGSKTRRQGRKVAAKDQLSASEKEAGGLDVEAGAVGEHNRNDAAPARNGTNGDEPSGLFPKQPLTTSVGPAALVLVLAAPADEASHSVVVANLAATFAETGWDVAVIRMGSSSLGHSVPPTAHLEPRPRLDLRATQVPGVRAGDWSLGDDIPTATWALADARGHSDLVLVDVGRVESPEFAELAPLADGVLAVCEIGSTNRANARQAAETVDRSGARFYGVVLTAVPVPLRERLRGLRRPRSPLHRATPPTGSDA